MAELEETLKEGGSGGIEVRKEKIWSLTYADDIVLLVKTVEGLRIMMEAVGNYLRKLKLQLNTEKSKIVVFRKAGRRKKKEDWTWEGKNMQEVDEYKYLGFDFHKGGGIKKHVREIEKAVILEMS